MARDFDASGIWAVLGAVVPVSSWTEGDYLARVTISAVVLGGLSMLKLRPAGMPYAISVVIGASLVYAATAILLVRDTLVSGEQEEVIVETAVDATFAILSLIAIVRVIGPRWTCSLWQNNGSESQ